MFSGSNGGSNGIKFGTATYGAFKNITVQDSYVKDVQYAAMAVESILICNLAESRRQMENLPLTVMRNVPERKADAVRRRLRDLGATAVIRPTADQTASTRR